MGNLQEQTFEVECCWCAAEGIHHVVRYEPYEHSSGMCLSHRIANSLEMRFEIIREEIEKMRNLLPRGA